MGQVEVGQATEARDLAVQGAAAPTQAKVRALAGAGAMGARAMLTSSTDAEAASDRRRAERHRVLKGAFAAFNDGRSTISCIVRNLSEHGARLRFDNVLGVPNRFTLVLQDDRHIPCLARWRTGSEIGVQFLQDSVWSGAVELSRGAKTTLIQTG
jgi:hypothetical protein